MNMNVTFVCREPVSCNRVVSKHPTITELMTDDNENVSNGEYGMNFGHTVERNERKIQTCTPTGATTKNPSRNAELGRASKDARCPLHKRSNAINASHGKIMNVASKA